MKMYLFYFFINVGNHCNCNGSIAFVYLLKNKKKKLLTSERSATEERNIARRWLFLFKKVSFVATFFQFAIQT